MIDILEYIFDLAFHEIVEKESASPMRKHDFIFRILFCKIICRSRSKAVFARIYMPHRLICVDKHGQAPLFQDSVIISSILIKASPWRFIVKSKSSGTRGSVSYASFKFFPHMHRPQKDQSRPRPLACPGIYFSSQAGVVRHENLF